MLIDPYSTEFSSTATTVDKELFENVHPDATEDKTSVFSWEKSVSGLQVWAHVDSAFCSDKQNGRSST